MSRRERILDMLAGVSALAFIIGVSATAWALAGWTTYQAHLIDVATGSALKLPTAVGGIVAASLVTRWAWSGWR